VLTDAGIEAVENTFRCGNLFAAENLGLLADVQNSLHANALLRRDVDSLVKDKPSSRWMSSKGGSCRSGGGRQACTPLSR
jgi:hypothetical protein